MRKFLKNSEDVVAFFLKLLPFFIICLTAFRTGTVDIDFAYSELANFFSLVQSSFLFEPFNELISILGFADLTSYQFTFVVPFIYCGYIDLLRFFVDVIFLLPRFGMKIFYRWFDNDVKKD